MVLGFLNTGRELAVGTKLTFHVDGEVVILEAARLTFMDAASRQADRFVAIKSNEYPIEIISRLPGFERVAGTAEEPRPEHVQVLNREQRRLDYERRLAGKMDVPALVPNPDCTTCNGYGWWWDKEFAMRRGCDCRRLAPSAIEAGKYVSGEELREFYRSLPIGQSREQS